MHPMVFCTLFLRPSFFVGHKAQALFIRPYCMFERGEKEMGKMYLAKSAQDFFSRAHKLVPHHGLMNLNSPGRFSFIVMKYPLVTLY